MADRLECASPPDLTFSRILRASFGGEPVKNWNGLLDSAMGAAATSGMLIEDAREISGATLTQGHRPMNQYRPVPGSNWYVLNMSANSAFSQARAIARYLRIPFTIEFKWAKQEEAHRPNVTGLFEFVPVQSPEAPRRI